MTSAVRRYLPRGSLDILAMLSMVSFWPRSGTSGTARLWRIALSTCEKCEMASARNPGLQRGAWDEFGIVARVVMLPRTRWQAFTEVIAVDVPVLPGASHSAQC
jgi:hypothetical protein